MTKSIKREVLEALIEKWREKGARPEIVDGSPEGQEFENRREAERQGYRTCADQLNVLLEILG
ncbi:MAG: hypothetical protein CL489_06400 [Acidobacteria bacterium]|nr:hypothetical protein [Acidobacteriota bacterium]|tara:strand:- start:53219 stop:53407 length:189 start_codon:yes stop_codon:yes gene_type:complete